MEYLVSDTYDEDVAYQAARLHIASLGYRSFITLFGETFMARLYRAIIHEKNGFFCLAIEQSKLKGFIFALIDSRKLNRAIVNSFPDFIFLILKKIIIRPSLVKRLFETLTYSKKEYGEVKAELMVMAVEASSRSKGIGQELLVCLENELRKRRIQDYKVTVHQEMDRSIHFYQKNGLKYANTFKLYNYDWDIYQKQIQ